MEMFNPMHPGEVIKELYINESGMSLRAVAEALGVSAPTFSRLVAGKSSVSVEMACRLERVLGGSAESWLQMQINHDMWHTRQSDRYQEISKLKKLELA
ncbi:addiction module antidote protein, HigA family [Xenococcus sp. PCC 7305]|uniref:HigA family addiction module antitoxin n=1 Tax=Xenococcus sp. PCC 7305 TaxID=102125 RepID=UPI0002AC1EE0|nr:HigA family addiction module antitoxin [Xenococcus sp. PCC 7305]ELS03280.1 addiction module antidote protein, HigA family [Xenococcus sp. PCC 7305]